MCAFFYMNSTVSGLPAADVEFDGVVSESGTTLEIPAEMGDAMVPLRGRRVRVRIRSEELAIALQVRGVTDEEIARIAAAQSEDRQAVVRFLLSEGALRRGKATRFR